MAIKKIIAIYPGRFQPFGKHHETAFKWLQKKFGAENTYIATSNKTELPKSPFTFSEKKEIISQYGLENRVVQTKNPYQAEEITSKYNPETTAVVFMVGEKDMKEDPRFAMKPKKDGSPSYYQEFEKNKTKLQPLSKHGHLVIAPHVSISIPGYGEMSGTNLRKALGANKPRSQKIQQFKAIFGWYDKEVANMIFDKLETKSESMLFSKSWWADVLDLREGYMSAKQQTKHTEKVNRLKQFLNTNTGREFVYDFNEFPKTVFGVPASDLQESMLNEGGAEESIQCEICKQEFKQITKNHLKHRHNTTLDEYISKYPDAKLLSDSLRKELRDSNPMKDKKNIAKIAETKLIKYGDAKFNNIQKAKDTKLEKYGDINYNNPRYGDDNPSKRPEVRKLISQKVTESYKTNPELKNKRSEIGQYFGFGNKQVFKKKMIDKGYWLPESVKSEFEIYRGLVKTITESNYQTYFREIPNAQLRSKKMHLDHKYSIYEGFLHDIHPAIIGHYKNLEIMNHSLNESKHTKSSITLKQLVEEILTSKNTLDMGYQILMCGGAGGHMAHPFDINSVKTGTDLIDVFEKSIKYLQSKSASVKIDGVNASIRFVELDGKKQFVMDRGSSKPLDVRGVTKADLEDRFGPGHGMINVGGTVLDIFNESIPKITPALKKLGLWDNPNIMFNIEYVAGSTNVLQYEKNFLAIHGLLEIVQVTEKRRATKEIRYSKPAMQNLLDNLAPAASKKGYEVLGSVPTTLTATPNLNAELNKKYTVTYDNAKSVTKTLKQWLAQAQMPSGAVKTLDGKTISPLSKEVLLKLSQDTPLTKFIADSKNYKKVIDGYVIYLATMKLGDAILSKLDSPLGPVSGHEGIVIRDKSIYNKPFKITGKFILGGLASSFRK